MEVDQLEQQEPQEQSVEKSYKAVAFKTRAGKEVNFNANPVRKSTEQKKEAQKNKIIKQYEAQKRRDARAAKKNPQ